MGRWIQRGLMVVVGLSVFVVYAAGAALGYLVLSWVWLSQLDPVSLLLAILLAAVVLGLLSYRLGTARVLAAVDARPLGREQAPALYTRLEDLAGRMDLERPELRVGQLGEPNALSLGRAGAGVVVLDVGLLRLLELDELEGILAHELAHLEGNDVLIRTMATTAVQTVVGLFSLFVLPLVLLAVGIDRSLAWITGRPDRLGLGGLGKVQRVLAFGTLGILFLLTLSVRAYSRRREFEADERAVMVTGRPASLASALQKIQRASEGPWGLLSHLYVSGDESTDRLRQLVSTHPPIEERVQRLHELAARREAARWTRIPVE